MINLNGIINFETITDNKMLDALSCYSYRMYNALERHFQISKHYMHVISEIEY